MRKVKIACTIGPASESTEVLEQLIAAGMDVARLNLSHGTHQWHEQIIKRIRAAARRKNTAVAILCDLQGPRIRAGIIPEGELHLRPHQRVTLVSTKNSGRRTSRHWSDRLAIPVSGLQLVDNVRPGSKILIDDGLIELVATRVTKEGIECEVTAGGAMASRKGVNFPGHSINAPSVTRKDRRDLKFAIANDVEYIALSFVRSPGDLVTLRRLIHRAGKEIPIIAKIERPEAVTCLEPLMEQSDGIMIARGDLALEIGPEAVPVLQKRIIAEANRRHCLVITATQMLGSMAHSPTPTRAEASDVANAVFDGTDAVMLSSETSTGSYPIKSLEVMDRIVRAAEHGVRESRPETVLTPLRAGMSVPEAICTAAAAASSAIGARAIVVFTESGKTAVLMAKQRPVAPVIAFTPSRSIMQRMALYWGVIPHEMPLISEPAQRVRMLVQHLKKRIVHKGDRVVIVMGSKGHHAGDPNFITLHVVE